MNPFSIDILTPQGYLSDIQKNPNLDVSMNLFNIPRAFSVSGFGDWNVGKHSFCVAMLALYWGKFRGYDEEKRNRLVVMGLTHDLHESATGDILPALKNEPLRKKLDQIQETFLEGLQVTSDQDLEIDLKILDIVAFLYEIQQAQTLNNEQRSTLEEFRQKQIDGLMKFSSSHSIENLDQFLKELAFI